MRLRASRSWQGIKTTSDRSRTPLYGVNHKGPRRLPYPLACTHRNLAQSLPT